MLNYFVKIMLMDKTKHCSYTTLMIFFKLLRFLKNMVAHKIIFITIFLLCIIKLYFVSMCV